LVHFTRMSKLAPIGSGLGVLPFGRRHDVVWADVVCTTVRLWVGLSALWVLTVLSGCASLGPTLSAPTLKVLEVKVIKGDFFEQQLQARMQVQNPNDVELSVSGITYTLELGGEELGRGLSGSRFVLPAKGQAEFDMQVTVNLAGTLFKLAEQARDRDRRLEQINYRLRGEVQLAKGLLRKVPFDEQGTLRLR
jgi:LEA14-like dessication related protein